jgi:hypothetical protein
MNGIHEVRGSIPLVSTNKVNNLGHSSECPFLIWCVKSVSTIERQLRIATGQAFQQGRASMTERVKDKVFLVQPGFLKNLRIMPLAQVSIVQRGSQFGGENQI